MPTGGPRRGRRDNGLVAAAYAAVGDVDPRIGEHLLDVLGASGIAAYLQPTSDQHPVIRTTTLPARPTDRLFADREHLETARGYLEELTEEPTFPKRPARRQSDEPTAADIDAVFARIVAGFNSSPGAEQRSWPDAEELGAQERPPGTDDRPPPDPPDHADEVPRRRRRTDWRPADPGPAQPPGHRPDPPEEPSLLDGLDRFGADLPDEEEEGYHPPPPPPFPRFSHAAVVATLAIVVGLVLFLRPTLLPASQNMVMLLGFSAVVGGFLGLVWRLRSGDDGPDEDPDDGARV